MPNQLDWCEIVMPYMQGFLTTYNIMSNSYDLFDNLYLWVIKIKIKYLISLFMQLYGMILMIINRKHFQINLMTIPLFN